MPAASIPFEAAPQPSGGACDVEEQPSARGRLRAAAPVPGANSKFKIQNYEIGAQPAEDGTSGLPVYFVFFAWLAT